MCSSATSGGTLLPYNLKINGGQLPYFTSGSSQLSMDFHRAQLQDYAQRLQLGLRSFSGQTTGLNPLAYHGHLVHPYLHPYFCKDPRARFVHEEPKPNHSYIGLIAMAILSSRDKKLVLSDIYQWILDNYSYFRTRGPGWRNSIRHNLSLNDCFIKSGRSANGKGHYWAIHPANLEDFQKGDFRRRRAQRRVRKHMGLAVPDDEDDDSPTPSPAPSQHSPNWVTGTVEMNIDGTPMEDESSAPVENTLPGENRSLPQQSRPGIRRQFDVESLLAPDTECYKRMRADRFPTMRSLEEPSAIFAFEDGSIATDGTEESDNGKYKNSQGDERRQTSGIRDSSDESQRNHDNDLIQGATNDKHVAIDDNSTNGSVHDLYSENEKECIALTDNCTDDSTLETKENVTRIHFDSAPSSPANGNIIHQETGESRSQVMDRKHMAQAYFSVNNLTNAQSVGALYGAEKQAIFSRSVGQMSKFPLISRQALLGAPLDIEAAQRWQQSMTTLLMKAQMKNKQEPVYQVIE